MNMNFTLANIRQTRPLLGRHRIGERRRAGPWEGRVVAALKQLARGGLAGGISFNMLIPDFFHPGS